MFFWAYVAAWVVRIGKRAKLMATRRAALLIVEAAPLPLAPLVLRLQHGVTEGPGGGVVLRRVGRVLARDAPSLVRVDAPLDVRVRHQHHVRKEREQQDESATHAKGPHRRRRRQAELGQDAQADGDEADHVRVAQPLHQNPRQ